MSIIVKATPEDFLVYEVLSNRVSIYKNNKQYTIYVLNKSGYTTFEAVDIVANYFNIDVKCIGYAGLKDEDGITYQYISIPLSYELNKIKIDEFNQSNYQGKDFISITFGGYSNEKINVGELQGNNFKIKLRNIDNSMLYYLKNLGRYKLVFPNYYDTQRFGLPNKPKCTHLIGEALLKNDYHKAIQYVEMIGANESKNIVKYGLNYKMFFDCLDRRIHSFYYNAYASFCFNNKLKWLVNSNIDYKEYKIEGITFSIPLSGKNLLRLCDKNESINISRYYFDEETELIEKESSRFICIDTIMNFYNFGEDTMNDGMHSVDVNFFLPSGVYATMVIKQLEIEIENYLWNSGEI